MCKPTREARASETLAREMAQELCVLVDPATLERWIGTRWDRISVLAHSIHDAYNPKLPAKSLEERVRKLEHAEFQRLLNERLIG